MTGEAAQFVRIVRARRVRGAFRNIAAMSLGVAGLANTITRAVAADLRIGLIGAESGQALVFRRACLSERDFGLARAAIRSSAGAAHAADSSAAGTATTSAARFDHVAIGIGSAIVIAEAAIRGNARPRDARVESAICDRKRLHARPGSVACILEHRRADALGRVTVQACRVKPARAEAIAGSIKAARRAIIGTILVPVRSVRGISAIPVAALPFPGAAACLARFITGRVAAEAIHAEAAVTFSAFRTRGPNWFVVLANPCRTPLRLVAEAAVCAIGIVVARCVACGTAALVRRAIDVFRPDDAGAITIAAIPRNLVVGASCRSTTTTGPTRWSFLASSNAVAFAGIATFGLTKRRAIVARIPGLVPIGDRFAQAIVPVAFDYGCASLAKAIAQLVTAYPVRTMVALALRARRAQDAVCPFHGGQIHGSGVRAFAGMIVELGCDDRRFACHRDQISKVVTGRAVCRHMLRARIPDVAHAAHKHVRGA